MWSFASKSHWGSKEMLEKRDLISVGNVERSREVAANLRFGLAYLSISDLRFPVGGFS